MVLPFCMLDYRIIFWLVPDLRFIHSTGVKSTKKCKKQQGQEKCWV